MRPQSTFLCLAATFAGLSGAAQEPSQATQTPARLAPQAPRAAGAALDTPAVGLVIREPDWAHTVPPGEICGTTQRYMAELAARGIDPIDGLCPPSGPCDDPMNRDAAIPASMAPLITVRLSVHVFCENNGGNCAATTADVTASVDRLNVDFAPYGFQFTYDLDFINKRRYRYLDVNQETAGMKNAYADSPLTKLNIYVVDTGSGVSFGTFPWSIHALTNQGGIVMHEAWFGITNVGVRSTLTHEVGHCLGLWHTFHGVDEVEQCGDCYEHAGRSIAEGDITGDYCSDTQPSPRNNGNCFDPPGLDPCGGNPWLMTPYLNYMSYADQACKVEFTNQQVGRMHCWTHEVLSGWLVVPDTTPPAAPQALAAVAGSSTVSLDWDDNGESDLDGYRVYRSTTSGDPYELISAPIQSASSYADNTAVNGTTYFYVVTALDATGNESTYSAEVQATPQMGVGSVSVASITVDTISAGGNRSRGRATVAVVDHTGAPVANADVTGTFFGNLTGTATARTNAAGVAEVLTPGTKKGNVSIDFCVDDITNVPLPYVAAQNVETCDSN